MSSELPEEIEDLPPSSELVYRILRETGEATVADLEAETCCGRTTIRYALGRLQERDLVERHPDVEHADEHRWRVVY